MGPVKLDEESLRAFNAQQGDDTVKIVNLGKLILNTLEAESGRQPHLYPMGERAEAILEAYDDRQVSTGQAITNSPNSSEST